MTEEEACVAQRQYKGAWGFKAGADQPASLWSAAKDRSGGAGSTGKSVWRRAEVDTLEARPLESHLLMATCDLKGTKFLFINVYAPSTALQRRRYFQELKTLPLPENLPIIAGGDFNCILDRRVDRSSPGDKQDAGAKVLQKIIDKFSIFDPVEGSKPLQATEDEVTKFAGQHHTYRYNHEGLQFSSRIDRWYLPYSHQSWVWQVETFRPPGTTDHCGVRLHLQAPTMPKRICKQSTAYPLPRFAEAASNSLIRHRLNDLRSTIEQSADNDPTNVIWDSFKKNMVEELRNLKRVCRRRVSRGYKQKLRRLGRKLQTLGSDGSSNNDAARAAIIAEMDAITSQRRALRRVQLASLHKKHTKRDVKAFFARVSTKFGDNTIPLLDKGLAEHATEPADILADN